MKKIIVLFFISLCACTESQNMLLETFEPASNNLDETKTILVSKTTALRIAGNFFNKKTSRSTSTTEEVFTINDSIGSPLMYVINYSHGGFVVVSSKKTYYPVIAYSDKYDFPEGDMPEGLVEWIQDVKKEISNSKMSNDACQSHIQYLWNLYDDKDDNAVLQSRSTGDEVSAYAARITELRALYPGYHFYPLSQCSADVFAYGGDEILANFKNLASQYRSPEQYTIVAVKDNTKKDCIGPLLSTEWHQNSPFNTKCPNQSKAGCVCGYCNGSNYEIS